jgi:hypothetical protein
MYDALKAYLFELATNADRLAMFFNDPDAMIQSAALPFEDEAILRDAREFIIRRGIPPTNMWMFHVWIT